MITEEKICPIMSDAKDFCQVYCKKEKCMAWQWTGGLEDDGYCKLIERG